MPTAPRNSRPSFQKPRAEMRRVYEGRRGSARERGYDWAWDKASAAHLKANPLCVYCQAGAFGEARVTAAELVDHYWPHRGDRELFWARQWWCSSCRDCHVGPKQALERRGDVDLAALAARLGLPPRPLAPCGARATPPTPNRGG